MKSTQVNRLVLEASVFLLGAVFSASGAFAMDGVDVLRYAVPVGEAELSSSEGADVGLYVGASSVGSGLGCIPGDQNAVRGMTFGCTFRDLQRFGSMNRLIAVNEPSHILNSMWMVGRNKSATSGRNVRYEGLDPSIGVLSDGTGGVDLISPGIIPPYYAEFPSLDIRPNGLAVTAFQNSWIDGSEGTFQVLTLYNSTPSLADFSGPAVDSSLTNALGEGNNSDFKWPQVAFTSDGAGAGVTHVLVFSNRTDADGQILYTRNVAVGWPGVWEAPIVVGAGGFHLSGAITSSRKAGSQKVVIAAALGRGDGTALGGLVRRFNGQVSGQYDNDVYFMESSDAGASWGDLTNVTMRGDSLAGGFAAGAKLDVLYDPSDVFHVVWQASDWNGYAGAFTHSGRMFHYDGLSDSVSMVHDFMWNQTMCNGGVFNLNATNPQLSACDGKLYLTIEQFNDIPAGIEDDCSERAPADFEGAANGDIYLTVSSDGGQNWDLKRNLTATYTPDCDTIVGGAKIDCDSDVWHSTTRYGIDIDVNLDDFNAIADLSSNVGGYAGSDYLFVQYVNDSDPGGAIVGEGSWTNSGLKVFRFGCVEPISGARLATSLPQGLVVDSEIPELIGRDSTFNWILQNIGDVDISDLSVTLVDVFPAGHISLSGFGAGLLGAGASDSGFVVLNVPADSAVDSARGTIVVDGSFAFAPRSFEFRYSFEPPCCVVAGDGNLDGSTNIADVTCMIAGIFSDGTCSTPFSECPEQLDANGDGSFNVADVTYLISWIFSHGPGPVCPGNL